MSDALGWLLAATASALTLAGAGALSAALAARIARRKP